MAASFYWTQDGCKMYPVCQRCGKHQRIDALEGVLTDAERCQCPPDPEPPKHYAQGWVCPVCGRVSAPWVSTCPCYLSRLTITSGTTNRVEAEFTPTFT